ncbi:MAG: hypothetical protein OEV92_13985 [Nitrospinota bacterium]|nr:hypothetical protein [Nitrospinota bacterium]MDH4185334.1 hypothetical protein [Nitrospinota bacterium]
MALFLAEIIILAAVLAAIAYPLMGLAKAKTSPELLENEMSDLLYRKEAAYTALKDLEFDMRTGKIGSEDYVAMKSSLETEAITLLGLIDSLSKGVSSLSAKEKVEPKKGRFCPECGGKLEARHKFCPDCGSKL